MICGGRIYKGQDNYIELYVPDASGITGIEIYTGGELKITPEEYEIVDENTIGINLTAEDLDPLEDGVIYYTVEYEDGGMGTNSNYYLKTPVGYTASTLDELIEEAYDEGYADGQEDCTGGTCEGVYESGYTDGYESGYTEGYESGSTSGYEEGYASGSTDGYNSGHTDGEAEQKAKLTSTSITENNIYTRDDGWNYVTVNVPQTGHTDEELHEAYDSGFTQGEAAQKAKLVSTAFTENRLYFREDGFSTVSVNVPQTGYTQQDLDNAYASGKTDGYDSGYTEGYNGGYTDGYNQGTADGYQTGYAEGEEAGYQTGYSAGEEAGYHSGYTDGYQSGYTRGTGEGYQSGYTDGYDEAMDECTGDTPYSEQYLTIEALESGTLYVRMHEMGYSINEGPWETTIGETALSLNQGDKVRFKYSGTGLDYGLFSRNTLRFIVYGNIESLEYGDNFIGQTVVNYLNEFQGLFSGSTNLSDASNLILPATALTSNCYRYMFWGCTSLTTAPELPATTLASGCYDRMFFGCSSLTTAPELLAETLYSSAYTSMFSGCTNLNYIKCLAKGLSASDCIKNWVGGVAQTGTFVKAAGVTWPSGDSGIPSGWTVVDAS